MFEAEFLEINKTGGVLIADNVKKAEDWFFHPTLSVHRQSHAQPARLHGYVIKDERPVLRTIN